MDPGVHLTLHQSSWLLDDKHGRKELREHLSEETNDSTGTESDNSIKRLLLQIHLSFLSKYLACLIIKTTLLET